MLVEQVEGKWIDAFAETFRLCGVSEGETAAVLSESQSRNGTELRAFAGNFLYSTGANETAGRHTLGHFDLPMRNCTVTLDGTPVVSAGTVVF